MKVTSKGNPPPLPPPEPLPPRLPQTASNAAPALEKLGGGGFPEPSLPTSHFLSHLNYHICKEKCHGRGKHKLSGPGGGKAQSPELSPPLGTWSWDGGAGGQRYVPVSLWGPCPVAPRKHQGSGKWSGGHVACAASSLLESCSPVQGHLRRGPPPPQGAWGHWRGPSRGDACTPFPQVEGPAGYRDSEPQIEGPGPSPCPLWPRPLPANLLAPAHTSEGLHPEGLCWCARPAGGSPAQGRRPPARGPSRLRTVRADGKAAGVPGSESASSGFVTFPRS